MGALVNLTSFCEFKSVLKYYLLFLRGIVSDVNNQVWLAQNERDMISAASGRPEKVSQRRMSMHSKYFCKLLICNRQLRLSARFPSSN